MRLGVEPTANGTNLPRAVALTGRLRAHATRLGNEFATDCAAAGGRVISALRRVESDAERRVPQLVATLIAVASARRDALRPTVEQLGVRAAAEGRALTRRVTAAEPWTAVSRNSLPRMRQDFALRWFGAALAALLASVVLMLAGEFSAVTITRAVPASAERVRQLPDRASCGDIEGSDLRSPREGLWYESNCVEPRAGWRTPPSTTCNRTSLDPREFTQVTPDLYLFRSHGTFAAHLWYQSGESCFDLVSSRVVTAVCVDGTVTFQWTRDPCAAHGGLLVRVNGR